VLCDPRINVGAPIPNQMSELVVNRTHSAGSPTLNCVLFVSGYSTELIRIHPLIINRGHIRILLSVCFEGKTAVSELRDCSVKLSQPGRDNGRAQRHRLPHDNHVHWAAAVCAGIRASMGSLRSTVGFVMAYGRNGCVCPWRWLTPSERILRAYRRYSAYGGQHRATRSPQFVRDQL